MHVKSWSLVGIPARFVGSYKKGTSSANCVRLLQLLFPKKAPGVTTRDYRSPRPGSEVHTALRRINNGIVLPGANQPCRETLGSQGRRTRRGGLLLRSCASLCPALLHLLPQAVGLDQHVLRISKLLLPLVAKPAKVGPVPLFRAQRLNSPLARSRSRPCNALLIPILVVHDLVGSFLFCPCTIGATLNIMDYMSGKATVLFGIVGAAAVGIYFKWRRPRRASSDVLEPTSSVSIRSPRRIEIDDDAAADIIKRARPALERARESYAW